MEKTDYTSICMDKATHGLLKVYCKKKGYTIAGYIRSLVLDSMNMPSPVNPIKAKPMKANDTSTKGVRLKN